MNHKGVAMPDPDFTGAAGKAASQPRVSSTRNVIGLVVLVAVLVIGGIEISAKYRYNAAVKALNARIEDEAKETMTVAETENVLGKAPDGPGSDVQDGPWNYTKTTYTWNGLLKSYTVTAFYTKSNDARLHHFETEGAQYKHEVPENQTMPTAGAAPLP